MPLHSRTSNTLRARRGVERRASAAASGSSNDREDNINNNRFAPGIGHDEQRGARADHRRSAARRCCSSTMVNEVTVGYARNSYGFRPAEGKYAYDSRDWYRSALGVDPPRLEPFGAYRDPPGLGYDQADEYPYVPIMTVQRRAAAPGCSASYNPGASRHAAAGRCRPRTATCAGRSRTTCRGRAAGTTCKFGVLRGVGVEDRAAERQLHGELRLRAQRAESAQHGQRLCERAHRRLQHLHGADQPGRPRPPALADRRVSAGQLAREPPASRSTTACGSRTAAATTTRASRRPASYEPSWDPKQAPRLYHADLHDGRAWQPDLRGEQPAGLRHGQSVACCFRARSSATWCRAPGRRSTAWWPTAIPGMRPGEYFDFPPLVAAPRRRLRLGHQRQRQAGAAGLDRASSTPSRRAARGRTSSARPPAAFTRVVQWATFDDIANFANSNLKFVETPINVAGTPAARRARSRSRTTST